MAHEIARLPLPAPDDDAHPLDWYPEDEPESRTLAESEQWVDETLTRREMVKYERGAGSACNTPTPYITRLLGVVEMPFQRTTRRRRFASQPRVYFLFCAACDVVKIGFSWDFRERRKELQWATGHALRVLGIRPGGRRTEAYLHELFHADRVEGEWFRPTQEILRFIEEHTTLPSGMPRPRFGVRP